jgi:hypothetical protein
MTGKGNDAAVAGRDVQNEEKAERGGVRKERKDGEGRGGRVWKYTACSN